MYDVHTFSYFFIIGNRSSQTALVLRAFGDWNSCQQTYSFSRSAREKSAAPTHAVYFHVVTTGGSIQMNASLLYCQSFWD